MTIKTLCVALTLSLLLLTGCGSVEHKKQELLTTTLRTYEGTIRWGDLANAYGFLEPEAAKEAEIPDGLDNIQVTNYEVVSPPMTVGENGAMQTAQIRYVRKDQQMEKTIVDRQLWEFDAEAKRWYLMSTVPDFGQPKIRILPLSK